MPSTANNALNQVLIQLDKSLLSYVAEAWPWSSSGEADVQRAVNELVDRRRANVGRLADLLLDREWPIDFGAYPTDYTDLHYVALDYLLALVVKDQKQLTAEIETARQPTSNDAEGRKLLDEILADERETLARLEKLVASRAKISAA